jgi:glycosyltransferase involved in cell wall biosynthesis
VACDAVVPFHGHLDYVREAVESLLEQEHAEVIIHLVDDASPEDTTQLLNRWKSHPRLRTYRNSRNVGQYTSFNNVSVCFETELAAVQDADDISLPHRMVTSGSLLYWTGGEFFGGAVEWFGADQRLKPVYHETKQRDAVPRRTHGWSHYAPQKQVVYFVENPTAMFRVELFRAKGGYADFGDPLANRASLDTEFLLRCRASGTHFAISREIVTRYRVHTESATQNSLTGWGTPARTKAIQQVDFRSRIYHRTSRFDPRLFGSLGRYADVTRRV